MVLLRKEKSYSFSSSPANGALNVSDDGDRFSVQLNESIGLPRETIYATCSVVSASVWNVPANLAGEYFNFNLTFFSKHLFPVVGETISIDFPTGLYGIAEFQSYLSRQFVINGYPANLIQFSEESATQKTVLTLNSASELWVDFTQPNSCRELLGFESRRAPALPKTLGYSESSDNPAQFNRVNAFNIKSDLISNGIPTNGNSSGLLANIPIDEKPGSLINYNPVNAPSSNAVELISHPRNAITFYLTDELSRPVIMSEFWFFTLVIHYWIRYDNSSQDHRSWSRN